MIDLLLPGKTPRIKEALIDLYNKPEILFFGPDEGTADMMDWAASKLYEFSSLLVINFIHA
jgi:glutamate dehydrogenase